MSSLINRLVAWISLRTRIRNLAVRLLFPVPRRPRAAPSWATYDGTPFCSDAALSSADVLSWAPAQLTRADRLLLYTLVFTLRPLRYLEVGTLRGGSALIAAAAMDALQTPGRIICVDSNPQISPEHWRLIEHRATLVKGTSPNVLPKAAEAAQGLLDLVFIDGSHSFGCVVSDAMGVLPHMTDGAYILFHDSFCPDVRDGIDAFVASQGGAVVDFGSLNREFTLDPRTGPAQWSGIRMVQIRRRIRAA